LSSDTKNSLRILPLGGLGEIGMNCAVIEYGDEIIVIDCGVLFSDLDHFGVEFSIPDFTYLKDRKEKIKAIVITHGHEDHIGAIPFILRAGISAPIYASPFTSLMISERLKEYSFNSVELKTYNIGDEFRIGAFSIKTVVVNHSIVDTAALFIDTPVGKIVHTADIKIDPSPYFGPTIDLDVFEKAGDEGVLLLMSDSTNVEHQEHSLSEKVIFKKFEEIFSTAEGLTIVSMFSSNIGRIGQVLDLAKKLGKRIALSGRSMETNVRLGKDAGYLKDVETVLISLDDLADYSRKDVIVLSTGSQGEYRSALIRVAAGEHRQIQLSVGDRVVLSSKFIPGNEKAIGRMINNLFKQGAEVLYESVHDIHVSGHASRAELKTIIEKVRPRFFIPVHGEYRHLVHHAKLARETGVDKDSAIVAVNGDVIELSGSSCRIAEHLEQESVLVEGRDGNDISKTVLKDRRQLGEKGVVFSILVREVNSGEIVSGPEIITKGIANEEVEALLVDEAKKLVNKVVDEYERNRKKGNPAVDLQETIRIELRRFFKANVAKKPIVLPVVLDL